MLLFYVIQNLYLLVILAKICFYKVCMKLPIKCLYVVVLCNPKFLFISHSYKDLFLQHVYKTPYRLKPGSHWLSLFHKLAVL